MEPFPILKQNKELVTIADKNTLFRYSQKRENCSVMHSEYSITIEDKMNTLLNILQRENCSVIHSEYFVSITSYIATRNNRWKS